MIDDVRIAVNGAVPVHSVGGVSQDESGMRQGELLDVEIIRARILAAIRRSTTMTQADDRDHGPQGRRLRARRCSRAPSTTCAPDAATRSRGGCWSRCSRSCELVDRSIGVVGHGCYTQIITTADVEFLQCLHGRAPAVATGMKRMLPDRAIYTHAGRRRHGVRGTRRGAARRRAR